MSNKSKNLVTTIDESYDCDDIAEEANSTTNDIDWEQLDMMTDSMTSLVLSNNFTKKFQNSALGNYFNKSIYDQSKGTSPFQDMTHVHGFTLLLAFKYADINFDFDNNPVAVYAKQFEEISDIHELRFILECSFHDSDLRKFKSQEDIYLELSRSNANLRYSANLLDVENIEKLNRKLWNSPDYCTTLREKVIYFIFEENYVLKDNNIIDYKKIVKDYAGTKKLINDLLLIKEMEKI